MNFCLIAFVTIISAWALTGMIRRYAVRRLVDVPNDRSSHSSPTPRGGGLAIVTTTLAAVGLCVKLGMITEALAAALLGGGAVVAIVGFVDDHRQVVVGLRLSIHAVVVVGGVWLL